MSMTLAKGWHVCCPVAAFSQTLFITQAASHKTIIISEEFLPKNYLSLRALTDFFPYKH